MKFVYSSAQLLHSPPTQLHNGKVENYPEQPGRLKAIVGELKNKSVYDFVEPENVSEKYIEAIHGKQYLRYLKDSSAKLKKQEILYPSNFITDTYAPIDA